MPLYEYECDSCGHRFEVIQKFSDALVDTCPKCGSKVHKLMSSPAIQFKGSGFYINDYAKKDSSTGTKASSAKEGSTKEGSSSKEGSKEGSSASESSSSSSSDTAAKPAAPATTTKPD
jgi:putative FmdB family regulatory protein